MVVSTTSRIDLRAELKHVARRFEDLLRGLGIQGRDSSVDPGIRPDNIALVLPYFLVDSLPFDGDHRAARSMAVANAFGAAHFLLQDRLIDGDEALSPRALELSDRFLAQFLREYAQVPQLDGAFWRDFDRYLGEYFASLAWEAEVLGTARGIEAVSDEETPETLRRLGHRMAPLKIPGAAIASLAGRRDALPAIERFVDEFHAGYQLADDIEDLEHDLERGRWSVVAWIIARAAGRTEPPRVTGARVAFEVAVASGALESVIDMIQLQYDRALAAARSVGSPSLVDYMERVIERSARGHGRLLRRLRLTVGPPTAANGGGTESTADRGSGEDAIGSQNRDRGGPAHRGDPGEPVRCDLLKGIHAFCVGDRSYVYDIASGLFFEADPLATSLISWLESGAEPVDLRVLEMDHGAEHVREGLSEIALLRGSIDETAASFHSLREDAFLPSISSVALHLTGQCNLSCDYCYHGSDRRETPPMSERTAVRAVDLLFEESVGECDISVVFFGGEPLLCPDLIGRVVEYAKAAANGRRQRVSFHVTTNGTLLESELASRLTEMGVRILVSIDGTQADHDRHRVFPDGRGSYGALAARLKSLPPGTRVGARATVTPESGNLQDIVSHLSDLGCSVVHLAPVSGGRMAPDFSERLTGEFEDLARDELRRMLEGKGPIVGNFAEAVASLETGRMRFLPCGAGSRYLSVGADGTLFLCHRFAGDATYAVGHVFGGVDRPKVRVLLGSLSERAQGCASCWARWLCGGPCFHDLDKSSPGSPGPGAPRCALRTRILELAMWLYASLPPEQRVRAIGAARREPRPELGAGQRASAGGGLGGDVEPRPAGL